MHRLEGKLAGIALKISLYPLVLLFINVFISAEDLTNAVRGGVSTQGEYVSFWLHNFLYGGRGIFFALVSRFRHYKGRRLTFSWEYLLIHVYVKDFQRLAGVHSTNPPKMQEVK
jgi:hypothetical protein